MRGVYDSKYEKGRAKGSKYGKRGIEASNNGHRTSLAVWLRLLFK